MRRKKNDLKIFDYSGTLFARIGGTLFTSNDIVPYLTAGIGIVSNKSGDLEQVGVIESRKGKAKTNFIWNIGVGAQYNVNKNFALDLGYRYMDLGFSKVNDSEIAWLYKGGKQKIRGHQVIGSLVYNF